MNSSVVADRGYFKGSEIMACDEAGHSDLSAQAPDLGQSGQGALQQTRLQVHPIEVDAYQCPAARALTLSPQHRRERPDDASLLSVQRAAAARSNPNCTTAQYRRIDRWEHEAVVDAVQARLDREPERMRARRETVEHPFGTIKSWMGSTHFLTRGLQPVSTEMSLHVMAYNLKRMMNIFGVKPLIEAIQA